MELLNNSEGLYPLSEAEMAQIDGGIWPLIVIGVAAVLSACQSNSSTNSSGTQINVQCSGNCNIEIKGDTVKVYPKK